MRILLTILLLMSSAFGAVTCTELTKGSTQTGAASYATASVTPGANHLILVAVHNRIASTPPETVSSVTGNGLTYVNMGNQGLNTVAAPIERITMFRAMAASPSTGALTITLSGSAATFVGWYVDDCSGTDTSGTNGSGAILQTIINGLDTAVPYFSLQMGAFANGANATYANFVNMRAVPACQAGAYGAMTVLGTATTNVDTLSEWSNDPVPTPDIFCNGIPAGAAGIAVEIKSAVQFVGTQGVGTKGKIGFKGKMGIT